MSSNPLVGVEQHEAWMPVHESKRHGEVAAVGSRATRAEAAQRSGKRMVIAGSAITIVGVVAYCAVTFAGGMDADMGDILFRNAVPFARSTLALLGLGTLVWLIGSLKYLHGAMDADEGPGEDVKPGGK